MTVKVAKSDHFFGNFRFDKHLAHEHINLCKFIHILISQET